MDVKVLKPFPYAEDGIRIRVLEAGAVEPVHAELVPGLVAEGWVEDPAKSKGSRAAPVAPPPAPVAAPAAPAPADEMLLGSSVLAAIVEVGALKVQLGGLVVASFKESGLEAAAWNDLPEPDREARLAATFDRLNADPAAAAAEIDPASVIPDPPAGGEDAFDKMTDKELRAAVKAKTGVSPHNTVKRPALLEQARAAGA